jgi:hypothetical protein
MHLETPRPLILLTGATGYIGGRLLQALESLEDPVYQGPVTVAGGGSAFSAMREP